MLHRLAFAKLLHRNCARATDADVPWRAKAGRPCLRRAWLLAYIRVAWLSFDLLFSGCFGRMSRALRSAGSLRANTHASKTPQDTMLTINGSVSIVGKRSLQSLHKATRDKRHCCHECRPLTYIAEACGWRTRCVLTLEADALRVAILQRISLHPPARTKVQVFTL